jgi:hypothetical protein
VELGSGEVVAELLLRAEVGKDCRARASIGWSYGGRGIGPWVLAIPQLRVLGGLLRRWSLGLAGDGFSESWAGEGRVRRGCLQVGNGAGFGRGGLVLRVTDGFRQTKGRRRSVCRWKDGLLLLGGW